MMQEASDSSKTQNSPMKKLHSAFQFKSLDIYQKIDENFKVQTAGGAVLSIIGWVVIFILVLAEIRNYTTPRFQEHMVVDTSLSEQLTVNINITFHALTCNEAHVDVMDVAGDNQLNVEHLMLKQRLTPEGKPVGKAGIEIIGEGQVDLPKPLDITHCGSCYGAESEVYKCCNTCDELIKAYQEKDWSIAGIIRNSTQCVHERLAHSAQVNPGEGCTIAGTMKVNKVSGNFHIAHGESIVRDGRHIHHFNPATAPSFNVSHTINSISFGEAYPYMESNPLDGVSKLIGEGNNTGLFQYFIKVIPTVYTDHRTGEKVKTSQYTVVDRFRPLILPKFDAPLDRPMEAILPGIFFVYDMTPFMIEANSSSMPFFHLVTKICAIVGGVFTVIGVVDGLLYRLQALLNFKA